MTDIDKAHNGVGRGPTRPSLVPRIVTWPTEDDAPATDELFEERAAIREYDGKMCRADAEILARHDLAAELFPAGATA